MAQMSSDIIKISLYDFAMGMNNTLPAYKINRRALAHSLNMRVEDGELQTCPGRTLVNSGALPDDSRGIGIGQRADGTDDLLVVCSGGLWKLSGNTKTLLSKYTNISACCWANSGSGWVISSGNTTWYDVVANKDRFYVNSLGPLTSANLINEVSPDKTKLYLYSVGSMSGSPALSYIWRKVADVKTRMRMYHNRWYIGNKSDPMREWDPAVSASYAYRDVGMPSAVAPALLMSAGGEMLSGTGYSYKVCWEDERGRYGNPSLSASIFLSGSHAGVSITLNKTYPYWAKYTRIYRTKSVSGISAASAISAADQYWYYRDKVSVSATYWLDNKDDDWLSEDEQPPVFNYQPVSGADDFIFFRDRLIIQKGSAVYIGGLALWDTPHCGDPPGLFQPEYDPGRVQYLGRDSGQQNDGRGLFILRGKLYALQSDSLWRLNDRSFDSDVWTFDLVGKYGCESQWTVATDQDRAFWVGRKCGKLTVYMFDAIEEQVVPIGDAVQGTLLTPERHGLALSATFADCSMGYYRLGPVGPDDDGDGISDYELEYSSYTRAWAARKFQHLGKGGGGYASSDVSAYGAYGGSVYQLEKGLSDATSAMSYAAWFAEVSDPPELQGTSIREYPKHWGPLQTEAQAVSGLSASGITWRYSVDGAAQVAISGAQAANTSAANGAVKITRGWMQNEAFGRGCQIRLAASGTAVKFKVRGFTLKAQVEAGIEGINSQSGRT